MLLGGQDGYVRRFDEGADDDDEQAFTSYVDIGPFRMNADGYEGLFQMMDAIIAKQSGDITWALYTGNTAEATAGSSAVATGTLSLLSTRGRNYRLRPRRRGAWGMLRLSGNNVSWAVEQLLARIKPVGRLRMP